MWGFNPSLYRLLYHLRRVTITFFMIFSVSAYTVHQHTKQQLLLAMLSISDSNLCIMWSFQTRSNTTPETAELGMPGIFLQTYRNGSAFSLQWTGKLLNTWWERSMQIDICWETGSTLKLYLLTVAFSVMFLRISYTMTYTAFSHLRSAIRPDKKRKLTWDLLLLN